MTVALAASGWSSCVVLEPAHAEKQHAREPGDLLCVLVEGSRPVREGHKPNGGRARGRSSWATTNTMRYLVTPLSCVYSGVAFAGSGEVFWYVEANVRRFDGSVSPP
jgi:hypothetical protein